MQFRGMARVKRSQERQGRFGLVWTLVHTLSRSRSTAGGVPGGAFLSTSLTRPLPSMVPIT